RILGGPVGERSPWDQPGTGDGEVFVPARQVQIAQGTALHRVLHDDHPPTLAIAAAGGEAGRIEKAMDHSILDRLGQELAYRTRAPQGLDQVQVHRRTVAGRIPLDTPPSTQTPSARHCGACPLTIDYVIAADSLWSSPPWPGDPARRCS